MSKLLPHFVRSTSPKISMDDTHIELAPGFCQFELTVIGATGLCKTPIWSQSQGGYVTVAVGGRQIHKTPVVDTKKDPQWKDTFQFVAKRDDELTISIYATKKSSANTLLGKVEGSLEKVDCTGDEMSREVSATQSGTPFNLKFRFEPRSRLFGLIVGIDKYQSGGIRNLQGCKADAQSMVDLLSRKFHIRSSHFRCLADERATRSAIIDGFEHHLIENNNIERGDAILIFYAGHGSRATAPSRWAADERKVETICPHDERTRDCNGKEIFGIPDRTIGGLLRKLCSFKGSNITVICDSCHSGGNTRMLGVARQADEGSPLPDALDEKIWAWGLPPAAESDIPIGFLDMMMSSHVLLAACQHNEVALENTSMESMVRGAFTRCLVDLLNREKDLTRITYSALIENLPPLENQHPQCSGKNRGRALFGGVANRPVLLKLSNHRGTYRTEAGSIQGVVPGTPFAIHALGNIASLNSEIGILEADCVSVRSCTLRWQNREKFVIPPGARALMLNWRPDANILKVFVNPPDNDVKSIEHVYSVVDYSESPDLTIHCTPGGARRFERLDLIMSKYAQLLNDIPPEPSLSEVLKGVSHFNFHLSRGNIGKPLEQLVDVVLHPLTQSNPDQISEEAIYMPDGNVGMPLAVDCENIVYAASEDQDLFYGLCVTNKSGRHLFPYFVYFDPSDYSIQSWYHPPAETMAAPLPPLHKDNGPSELKVGYGEADVEAFQFTLADGIPADVGFLRLFVSTTYVDMSVLEQQSPFLVARGGAMKKPPAMDIWDAWTYVLKTVRR